MGKRKHRLTLAASSQPTPPRFQIKAASLTPQITSLGTGDLVAPTVYYTPQVWNQIQYLVARCPLEIGWLGLVDETPDGDYCVTEIFVPQQVVSGAETDIGGAALSALAITLMNDGKDPSKLRYWGHSHVSMGVSPSSQDERQISEFLDNCDFFIRGIYNKRGDSKVDVFDTTERVVYEAVNDTVHIPGLPPTERDALDDVIRANVRTRGTATPTPSSQSNYGWSPSAGYYRSGGAGPGWAHHTPTTRPAQTPSQIADEIAAATAAMGGDPDLDDLLLGLQ